ncbi:FAD:protein FMN transferase [Brevundimonas diminuta]|jgi:thiamine biosynthesis lipoprotein|uniref:FAD:protein FMN transferase n=1 Tax=Brevundimonas diminuta TaxID=293 RepID=A0A410NT50_BREDI|nr:FAD:protein FMN transferase [Brevundimonas diminuta]MBD3571398.1 FAD:protein FMN transferase [Brevundimonas diminuta]QAT12988.1 FAD:protein FMN transferase [Brevundimonas diminuta]QQB89666.1 FAD:protein FMN transferase [Brevundimonas diminuta]GEC01666.1 FAD:protein FMN transferase [Brevundimonas diminuta]
MKRSASAPSPILIGGPDDSRRDDRVLIPPMTGAPERPPSDLIWSLSGETMGTTWSVRLVPPPGAAQGDFAAAVEEELARIVAVFSPWEADSEISRFNAAPAGTWALSDDFWALLTQALDLADDVSGAVDPSLGALVDLWGFGPPGPRSVLLPLPSDEEVEAARAVSGWQKLRLHREAQAAIQIGGMKLDFSGIAKGHAVDRVSDRLSALGATSHLVEIGGELKGRGVKPDAQPWWVEIEVVAGSPAPRTVAALVDLAMATSGEGRRAFPHEGRLYSHTLDGATGRPVDNGLAQVTVFDASAMRADALATALTVLGPIEGPELAEALGLAAHFTERTPDGLIERMTPAFAAMLDDA